MIIVTAVRWTRSIRKGIPQPLLFLTSYRHYGHCKIWTLRTSKQYVCKCRHLDIIARNLLETHRFETFLLASPWSVKRARQSQTYYNKCAGQRYQKQSQMFALYQIASKCQQPFQVQRNKQCNLLKTYVVQDVLNNLVVQSDVTSIFQEAHF